MRRRGSKPYTPAAAREILARCDTDARPFAVEQAEVQRLLFKDPANLHRHEEHALAGLGTTQAKAADDLQHLDATRATAEHLKGYVKVLRSLADAQKKAAPLAGRGDFAQAGRILAEARRPLELLTYRLPDDLSRLGALKCLAPQPKR